jgi:hypothetical protein
VKGILRFPSNWQPICLLSVFWSDLSVNRRSAPTPGTSEDRLRRLMSVGLDQDPIEIKTAQQLLEDRLLTGFVGVIGRLGQRHPKGTGIDGDLGNEPLS